MGESRFSVSGLNYFAEPDNSRTGAEPPPDTLAAALGESRFPPGRTHRRIVPRLLPIDQTSQPDHAGDDADPVATSGFPMPVPPAARARRPSAG